MRRARADDLWRGMRKRENRTVQLRSLRIAGSPFAEGTVTFGAGMTVVAGLNGTGKTNLLGLIARELGVESGVQLWPHLELDVVAPSGAPVVVFNPAVTATTRQRAIRDDPNFDDLLQGVEPFAFDDDQVAQLSHLVGKKYDDILVSEIEDPSSNDATQPYFLVSVGNATYSSQEMGLGELATLELYWRVSSLVEPCFLLLDELDSVVSQHTAGALLDFLAAASLRDVCIVAATHRSAALARFEPKEVIICSEVDGSIHVSNAQDLSHVRHVLGGDDYLHSIVMTEDDVALAVASELMARSGQGWVRGVALAVPPLGGAGSLMVLERHIGGSIGGLRFLAVYDGDQTFEDDVARVQLPGLGPPEQWIRSAIESDPTDAAARLNRPQQAVHTQLGAIQGHEHHEWLQEFCGGLKVSLESAVAVAVSIHSSNLQGKGETDQFIEAVRQAVGAG